MIVLQWPAMLLLLFPIIMIESLVMGAKLGMSAAEAYRGAWRANLASTLLGIPLAWGLMFGLQLGSEVLFERVGKTLPAVETVYQSRFKTPILRLASVPLEAAWVEGEDGCLVAAAAAILLIPSFFLSVWIERFVCRRFWRSVEVRDVTKAVWKANLASYAFLMVGLICWTAYLYPDFVAREERKWSIYWQSGADNLISSNQWRAIQTNRFDQPKLDLQNGK